MPNTVIPKQLSDPALLYHGTVEGGSYTTRSLAQGDVTFVAVAFTVQVWVVAANTTGRLLVWNPNDTTNTPVNDTEVALTAASPTSADIGKWLQQAVTAIDAPLQI